MSAPFWSLSYAEHCCSLSGTVHSYLSEKCDITVTETEVFVKGLQREMAGLLSHETTQEVSLWFVASDYEIVGEKIRPNHSVWRGPKWTYPLSNQDLFLSFTRIGGGGEPFEKQVLGWVQENGLLRWKEPDGQPKTKEGEINQEPMSLQEFSSEVTQANNALMLLKQIRSGDYTALKRRISRTPLYMEDPSVDSGYYKSNTTEIAHSLLVVDDIQTQVRVLADEPASDDVVHEWAADALQYLVEQRLTRMTVVFTRDTTHPRPLSTIIGRVPYRPRLTPYCPDLETALWFQFASLVGDKRHLRECSECHDTFVGPERAKTCSDKCRKARSRRPKS